MRLVRMTALIVIGSVVLSCADMPYSPRKVVTLKGSVLDREGAAIPGARLIFTSTERLPETQEPSYYTPPAGYTETGADGSFALELSEGRYRVRVEPPYDTGTGYPSVSIARLDLGGDGGRLDYRYSGVMVSGSVIGPSGVPLQATVGAGSYGTGISASVQSKDGVYKLLLPSGLYRFYAYAGPYGSGLPNFEFEATVSAQDTTIDLDFSGHETKVVVTLQGAPLIGVNVSAEMQGTFAAATTD